MYANNLNVFDVTNENARIKEQVSGIKIKSRIKDQGSRVKGQGSRIKDQMVVRKSFRLEEKPRIIGVI